MVPELRQYEHIHRILCAESLVGAAPPPAYDGPPPEFSDEGEADALAMQLALNNETLSEEKIRLHLADAAATERPQRSPGENFPGLCTPAPLVLSPGCVGLTAAFDDSTPSVVCLSIRQNCYCRKIRCLCLMLIKLPSTSPTSVRQARSDCQPPNPKVSGRYPSLLQHRSRAGPCRHHLHSEVTLLVRINFLHTSNAQ